MSFKAQIQTAVHISYLHIRNINSPGLVQYRIGIYYSPKKLPHKIFFVPQNIDNTMRTVHQRNNEPQLEVDCCYSQKYQVNYINEPIRDETTYYFKAYIDKQLLNNIDIYINIDLVYSINYKSQSNVINTFQAKIKKYSNIFEYIPVCFDSYGALTMDGTYHSTLMAFKFQKNQDQTPYIRNQYSSFRDYLLQNTGNYRKSQILRFCDEYREQLQGQLNHLQQRQAFLNKIIKNSIKNTAYTKVSHNKKINSLLSKQSQMTLNSNEQQFLISFILEDILNIKTLIYCKWNHFNQTLKLSSHRVIRKIKESYNEKIRRKLSENVYSNRIRFHDWTYNKYANNTNFHQIKNIYSQEDKQSFEDETFLIKDVKLFGKKIERIKIFEEIYETGNLPLPTPIPQSQEHIIFLVHGFQAHRNDFLDLKFSLESMLKVKVYISSSNIDKTQDNLDNMGARLSNEVKKYLNTIKKPFKISFIGHSMGGIIIRSAIQYLSSLEDHFHAYISLCSPHLGYLYGSSTLVKAGIWYMNNFDKYTSMIELTMQDSPILRQTFLYKLSKRQQLNKFQKITFIASSQDQYVPYSSARAQKNVEILSSQVKNKNQRQVICQMVDNLLCSIEASQITRIDVKFNIKEANFDSFIGRLGHVKFLCDEQFLKHFAITLNHLLL